MAEGNYIYAKSSQTQLPPRLSPGVITLKRVTVALPLHTRVRCIALRDVSTMLSLLIRYRYRYFNLDYQPMSISIRYQQAADDTYFCYLFCSVDWSFRKGCIKWNYKNKSIIDSNKRCLATRPALSGLEVVVTGGSKCYNNEEAANFRKDCKVSKTQVTTFTQFIKYIK